MNLYNVTLSVTRPELPPNQEAAFRLTSLSLYPTGDIRPPQLYSYLPTAALTKLALDLVEYPPSPSPTNRLLTFVLSVSSQLETLTVHTHLPPWLISALSSAVKLSTLEVPVTSTNFTSLIKTLPRQTRLQNLTLNSGDRFRDALEEPEAILKAFLAVVQSPCLSTLVVLNIPHYRLTLSMDWFPTEFLEPLSARGIAVNYRGARGRPMGIFRS